MRSPRILPARLSLSSSVLLELLQLGYFAIFHESHVSYWSGLHIFVLWGANSANIRWSYFLFFPSKNPFSARRDVFDSRHWVPREAWVYGQCSVGQSGSHKGKKAQIQGADTAFQPGCGYFRGVEGGAGGGGEGPGGGGGKMAFYFIFIFLKIFF